MTLICINDNNINLKTFIMKKLTLISVLFALTSCGITQFKTQSEGGEFNQNCRYDINCEISGIHDHAYYIGL